MIRLPLYDHIGCFGLFFDNHALMCNYLESHIMSHNMHDLIFLVTRHTKTKTVNSYMGYSYYSISWQEYNSYKHPNLPIWILYEDTFDDFITGNYLDALPKSAEIIPTMQCCFRCEQCSYQQVKKDLQVWENSNNRLSSELKATKANMQCFINRLVDAGVINAVFTGGGEPLCNRTVTLYGMQLAKDRGINTALYTNGFYLTEETIRKIISIQPLLIRISIYGMDEISFSNYTNSSQRSFKKVIENIKTLIKYKKENDCSSNISLSFLMHPTLFPNPEIIDGFFENNFSVKELKAISVIRFTPAVDYYTNIQHSEAFFSEIQRHIHIIAEKYQHITNIVLYVHRINDLYKAKEYKMCRASGFYIEVSPNGDLYLCCEKLMNKAYIIGNIVNDNISNIYASEKRQAVIDEVNLHECANCPSLCKPHEMNKQLNQIKHIEIPTLHNWRNEMLKISNIKPYFAGKFNAFES